MWCIGFDILDFVGYMVVMYMLFVYYYWFEDMFVGNLMIVLGCIDVGIICIVDNFYNLCFLDYFDMVVYVFMDFGICVVYVFGVLVVGEW